MVSLRYVIYSDHSRISAHNRDCLVFDQVYIADHSRISAHNRDCLVFDQVYIADHSRPRLQEKYSGSRLIGRRIIGKSA